MSDAMLEEIWRVREELLKKHGGMDGYFKFVQRLERAQRRRKQARRGKSRARRIKTSP
jgi:hypothetical protein